MPSVFTSSSAEILNQECYCISTDVLALRSWLENDLRHRGLLRPIVETHPHLFSAAPVFVSSAHAMQMQRVISAIESVVALPAWQRAVLAHAPEIAQHDPLTRGVFMGYDFHLGKHGPQLIEINTNAGGALLNIALMRAQRACCDEVQQAVTAPLEVAVLEDELFAMFIKEWRLARGDRPLQRIAIVDSKPAEQYLYPEFLLIQQLFESHGIATVIADPGEFRLCDGKLLYGEATVDLVYLRLTDFYIEQPENALLNHAYRTDAAVFTPHPRAHALYANKHNLELLTDETVLRDLNVPMDIIDTLLASIPRTIAVQIKDKDALWNSRKQWFFKPATGFGSRGSYRGEKLTRHTFDAILQGDYVAQALTPPTERMIQSKDGSTGLKLDLRNYSYNGKVQLVAARLYQGQTTNFRTPGGGFAPVYYPPF